MAPRKQPPSLYDLGIRSSLKLINVACHYIDDKHKDTPAELKAEVEKLNWYLRGILPARLFDVLCLNRTCFLYVGIAQTMIDVLTHPNMTVFYRYDVDNNIPQSYWVEKFRDYSHLVILDLKFVCTDEILKVVGVSCPLIEELNIVSNVNFCATHSANLIRNVSDEGLFFVAKLRYLRILYMDPPKTERSKVIGRCVSQAGIITMVNKLLCLEELHIESCDIGSTLINTSIEVRPLILKKINCHFASGEGIKKLIRICPILEELSVTHLSKNNKNAILQELAANDDSKLNKLNLSFFSFNDSLQIYLQSKGRYLTQFSLWEIENTLDLNAILVIGQYCPNIDTLCIMTQSRSLAVPPYFKKPRGIFSKLTSLTMGNENFSIKQMVTFFLECTESIEKIILKYQSKVYLDDLFLDLLKKKRLNNLRSLWLDCSMVLSKFVVKTLIALCENLRYFTLDCNEGMTDVRSYIKKHNLDIELVVRRSVRGLF